VLQEKQSNGKEFVSLFKTMENTVGKIKAVGVAEIGGGNGLEPLVAGALLDLPIV
jgi:DUF917 family protein